MAMYQSPEDEAVFKGILQRDPESQKCFECNYPNAPWCDINHGIFVCLDCSGVHRGLGVHLSFVRSSSMDGWSNWRPEKLKQMEIGGNARARKFFEAKGVPKAPIRARYEHVGALMYKDMLEAEVAGRPFNERTWQPPDWAVPKPPGAQQQGRPGSAAASNDRFRGQGSQPAKAASSSTSTTDWLGALSSGISTVATQATVIASTAATVTVQSSQQLASKIQQQAGNPDDLTKKAQETAAVATQAVSSAWGALSSWTSSAVSSLAAVTTGGSASSNRADEDDDGLGGLTRNLKTEAPAPDPRFRGVEHRAERQSELSGLTSGLSRTGKYEGIGGDETPTQPATAVSSAPPRQASSGNIGSRQTSQNNFATSPVARQTATASPPVAKPATSTSPVPASAASPTGRQAKKQEEKKTTSAVPAEWGWDDE